eukprot:TRINITY_DN18225_c0_g1_i1.p1 TRINITY_DN18225_c0_g1~~TRINITY_DN18225_c0_g1_i1.p1  ORF type:complete len:410 (+),score=60.11 TRINITY_DN18225_c0_g1_i1:29-1231(+)
MEKWWEEEQEISEAFKADSWNSVVEILSGKNLQQERVLAALLSSAGFTKEQISAICHVARKKIPKKVALDASSSFLSHVTLEVLGEGAHGCCKKVGKAGKIVTRKVASPGATAQLEKERRILALIPPHPTIVQLADITTASTVLYLDYVEAVSLAKRIAHLAVDSQVIPVTQLMHIVLQLLHALKHLHAYGILHRDVKADNVLLRQNGEIVLIDFTAASAFLFDDGSLNQVAGTISHMSPEALLVGSTMQSEQIGPGVDVWALGVLILEALGQGYPWFMYPSLIYDTMLVFWAMSGVHWPEPIPEEPLGALLKNLFVWDPKLRPSAETLIPQAEQYLEGFDRSTRTYSFTVTNHSSWCSNRSLALETLSDVEAAIANLQDGEFSPSASSLHSPVHAWTTP